MGPTANFGPYGVKDPGAEVSKGNVDGQVTFSMSGVNTDIDADVREDLWPNGGVLTYLPSADTMTYVSSDAGDTEGIFVSGDLAGIPVTENVTLNGTTPVLGSQEFDVINFMFLTTGVTNIGFITATATNEATVQCSIGPVQGISQHGFYRVPLGYNVIFKQITFNAAKQAGGQAPVVNFNLYARFTPTTPWISLINGRLDAEAQSGIVVPYPLSNVVSGGADLRFSAVSSEVNTEAAIRLVGVRYAV